MKSVVFYVSKETGNFKSYQIIDRPKPEIDIAIKNFNSIVGNPKLGYVVTNQHVVDAIVQNDLRRSVLDKVEKLKFELFDLGVQMDIVRKPVEELINFVTSEFTMKEDI